MKCSRNRFPFMPLQNELSPLTKQGVSSAWDSGYSVCLLHGGKQMPLWCASSNLAVDDAMHLQSTLYLTLPRFMLLSSVVRFLRDSDWPHWWVALSAGIVYLHFTSRQQTLNSAYYISATNHSGRSGQIFFCMAPFLRPPLTCCLPKSVQHLVSVALVNVFGLQDSSVEKKMAKLVLSFGFRLGNANFRYVRFYIEPENQDFNAWLSGAEFTYREALSHLSVIYNSRQSWKTIIPEITLLWPITRRRRAWDAPPLKQWISLLAFYDWKQEVVGSIPTWGKMSHVIQCPTFSPLLHGTDGLYITPTAISVTVAFCRPHCSCS